MIRIYIPVWSCHCCGAFSAHRSGYERIDRYLAGENFPSVLAGRKEKEVVDVRLAGFAPAVGKQRVGILKDFDIELIDRNDVAILDKESAIAPILKELENRFSGQRPMPVFRFDKENRPASFEQAGRAVQNIQLMAFDVDFHEGDVVLNHVVKTRHRNIQDGAGFCRKRDLRLEGRKTMNRALLALRNQEFRRTLVVRQRDFMHDHIRRRRSAENIRHCPRRFERMHAARKPRQLAGIEPAIGTDIDGDGIVAHDPVQKREFHLRRFWTVHEMPPQPESRKSFFQRILDLPHSCHRRRLSLASSRETAATGGIFDQAQTR
ncbi:hypothetical protein HNQ36_003856 [Afipia massiliensis]|uniref:Uncharacterized protein n=1 Tax=Afipia massiliensis TaxID=211460 RepID=A0A840NAY1_9BRAD|nr:hypothetical protein [Afipia massiliensis]